MLFGHLVILNRKLWPLVVASLVSNVSKDPWTSHENNNFASQENCKWSTYLVVSYLRIFGAEKCMEQAQEAQRKPKHVKSLRWCSAQLLVNSRWQQQHQPQNNTNTHGWIFCFDTSLESEFPLILRNFVCFTLYFTNVKYHLLTHPTISDRLDHMGPEKHPGTNMNYGHSLAATEHDSKHPRQWPDTGNVRPALLQSDLQMIHTKI